MPTPAYPLTTASILHLLPTLTHEGVLAGSLLINLGTNILKSHQILREDGNRGMLDVRCQFEKSPQLIQIGLLIFPLTPRITALQFILGWNNISESSLTGQIHFDPKPLFKNCFWKLSELHISLGLTRRTYISNLSICHRVTDEVLAQFYTVPFARTEGERNLFLRISLCCMDAGSCNCLFLSLAWLFESSEPNLWPQHGCWAVHSVFFCLISSLIFKINLISV